MMERTIKGLLGMEAWKERESIDTGMDQCMTETGRMERGMDSGEKKTKMGMCMKESGRTTVVMEKE